VDAARIDGKVGGPLDGPPAARIDG
jgi:hypothetical protein